MDAILLIIGIVSDNAQLRIEKQKVPHCWNNFKIKYQNRRKRQNHTTTHFTGLVVTPQ
jgi:hypothetical protein